MNNRLPIIGIRHHDFKRRLDELFEIAQGRRVTISVEHDNPVEVDAVICFMGDKHLGYVRSGMFHDRALTMLRRSDRRSIMGRVVDTERENRVIWIEVKADDVATECVAAHSTLLETLNYDGPMIPRPKGMVQLHSMIDTLEMLVEDGDAPVHNKTFNKYKNIAEAMYHI